MVATGPSRSLRTAMLALYGAVTVFAFLATLAFYRRKQVWAEFADGRGGFDRLKRVEDADTFVALTVLVGLACLVAAAVVTIVFLQRLSDGGASPRKIAGSWLAAFAVGFVLLVIARVVGNIDRSSLVDGFDSVTSKLQNQSIFALLGSVAYAASTVLAARATATVS
jgi:hypothetical protein